MVLEPGSHGEEGEVHGGSGGEEGGARDEHPGAGHHHAQAQPPNICSELTQHATVKINLIIFIFMIQFHLKFSNLRKRTNESQ